MGIQVECPNGHIFKVKDKYAGKKGLCPHCEGQVIVQVPDALTANSASDIVSALRMTGTIRPQSRATAIRSAISAASRTGSFVISSMLFPASPKSHP